MRGLSILVISTRWNSKVVDALVEGSVQTLKKLNARVTEKKVSGSFELPYATKLFLSSDIRYDACISIGVLIKGETMHFEYIAAATTNGLMRVSLDLSKPVIFGVLTCLSMNQALARAGLTDGGHNHGVDWAIAAIEQAMLK